MEDLPTARWSRDIFTYYYDPTKATKPQRRHSYRLLRFRYQLLPADRIVVILWDDASKLNPITPRSLWELFFLYEHFERDPGVDVLIWTGVGRAFCSGISAHFGSPESQADVPEPAVCLGYLVANKGPCTETLTLERDLALKGLVLRSLRFSKLSVAAVNGLAVGGGANIAFLLHDFVLCASDGKYRYPFGELGLSAEVGSSWLLPRRLGMARAKELLLSGRWFTASEAEQWGLCNRVVDKTENLLEESVGWCRKHFKPEAVSHAALKETKRLLHEGVLLCGQRTLSEHLTEENKTLEGLLGEEDTRTRMQNWREKLSTTKSKM